MAAEPPATFKPRGSTAEIEHGLAFQPRFDQSGLIAAIVSDAETGEVLMFAWMNAEALRLTLSTRLAHFWSRSRNKLWQKGEDSGNRLSVREIRIDCDQDVLWLSVVLPPDGVACHTGSRSCFYRALSLAPNGQISLTPA
jgi:phosphoribosyl-AMP cyclohydrolase